MPLTRAGRGTALRNSILAQAWFLVNNQVPPNLADMMNEWRKEAWAFYGNHGREAHGSTTVRHDTLVQDYYREGGPWRGKTICRPTFLIATKHSLSIS